MSLTTPDPPAAVPARPQDVAPIEGMEDFDPNADLVIPRLNVDHKTAQYVDSLTNKTYQNVTAVVLGLVKQRVLWADEVRDNDMPLCRSLDFEHGMPDAERFPWKAATFDRAQYSEENVVLPCGNCRLKEWNSHPKRPVPWCSVQFVFPCLVEEMNWTPALFTVQRSALNAAQAYLTSFARDREPLFTSTTRLGLQAMRRGTNDYAVPVFTKGEPTSADEHADYVAHYRRLRGFVQTPRQADSEPIYGDESTPPAQQTQGQPAAAPAAPASQAGTGDDDNLPF